jgi:uncharacterized protein (TIGR03086 family)
MMITEYVVHGWDLATATDQVQVLRDTYTDAQLERVLARGQAMLQPQYRGPGKSFAEEVAVSDDAPALDRVVAWAGRTP